MAAQDLFDLLSSLLLDYPIAEIAFSPHALVDANHPPFALYDSINLVIPIKVLYSIYPLANSLVKQWRTLDPRQLDAASRIVLLQSPEHLTALNCRKRLLSLSPKSVNFDISIEDEYLQAIEAGTKTWEGRINRSVYSTIKIGDRLVFRSSTSSSCKVVSAIQHSQTFSAMLSGRHTQFLPSCGSLESAIATYQSFPSYAQGIKDHGCIAFQLCTPYLSPSIDLQFLNALLTIPANSKAPPLWSHRRYLLSLLNSTEDLEVPQKACERYKRNYAAYVHRTLLSQSEISTLENWLDRNPSDHSAAVLLLHLLRVEDDGVWERSVQRMKRFAYCETGWLLLRGLCVMWKGRMEEAMELCEEYEVEVDVEEKGMETVASRSAEEKRKAALWAGRTRAWLLWQSGKLDFEKARPSFTQPFAL